MRTFAALLASASLLFAGCAIQNGTDTDEGNVEQSDDALATKSLYGTWEAVSGPIYRIEFTETKTSTLGGWSGRSFNATVDNGVRCFTTPCDSSDDVGGVYRVSFGTRVTFASFDKPSATFAKYLGDYSMKLSKDGVLTLKKTDGTVVAELKKRTGTPCGTNVCGAGTYCCNPVMSICAKIGMMCIQ